MRGQGGPQRRGAPQVRKRSSSPLFLCIRYHVAKTGSGQTCGKPKTTFSYSNFSKWLNATGRPMHLELCRGYKQGPGELSEYVPKVSQSWRVAGDNQDDWEDGTRCVCARLLFISGAFYCSVFYCWNFSLCRRTIEDFVNNSKLGGPYGWNYGDFLTTGGAGCGILPPSTAHGP